MSVRSFEQIVGSPDPIKDSAFLRLVEKSFLDNAGGGEYLCHAARCINGYLIDQDARDAQRRMGNLLAEFGVCVSGSHFCAVSQEFDDSQRGKYVESTSRDGLHGRRNAWFTDHVSRLVLIRAMIAKLEREGR